MKTIAVNAEQEQKHSEFEREPVPVSKTKGLKAFVGMYAGEHCAGTELMIGPLFFAAGVSAFDVVFGLLFGNGSGSLELDVPLRADRGADAPDALFSAGEDLWPSFGHAV